MTVKDSTIGASGIKPTQPSTPHRRPDIQENAVASHAQRKIEPRSLERLKKRRDASTRIAVSRYSAASQPISQLAETAVLR
ncbi:hypothetical protein, partial [Mesorhizobium sp. M7A.F.Ca.CA.002.04.1.1]|uniref:hypothetical protein n=1 Tax=Mesorhizobium sp. M7A.F.Ca.CA.002.04.1.1 TaxID=2496681 RepID=UPI0013E29AA9